MTKKNTTSSSSCASSAAADALGSDVIGIKKLSKESATSDILSMADKILDGDDDDILGFNEKRKRTVVPKKKKKKKMTRMSEDPTLTSISGSKKASSISTQNAAINFRENREVRDAKVVNKLRKVVKSSSAPDGTQLKNPSEGGRGRLRPIEEKVARLEKAVAIKDLGAVELLKLLREKSTTALDILYRANNILNSKLNSAYKIALKDLQDRQKEEIERFNADIANAIDENDEDNKKNFSKKSNSKHRGDVYRNRLKEKHQEEADAIWESLQEPMRHLDDAYADQVQSIQSATDKAATVGKRSVQLMELYARDAKIKDRAKLLDKLNMQTRKAVFESCQKIADICGNVKHIYTSLSEVLFTSDGGIVGLNVGGWEGKTLRASISPPRSNRDASFRADGPSGTRSPIGNVTVNSKSHYEENGEKKVLSQNNSPNVLDNFSKALEIEMTRQIKPHSPVPPTATTFTSAMKDAMITTTSILSPGSNYDDDDFEASSSPALRMKESNTIAEAVNMDTETSPKKFLQSLSDSSGLKPAENILETSGDGEVYDDDFEESSPLRYEHKGKKSPSKVERDGDEFKGDYRSECERLGIDPNSSWRLLDRRSDLANPNISKKKKEKDAVNKKLKKSSRKSTEAMSPCHLCKQMYSGPGKALPNMNTLDQPAVDVVKGMIAKQNEENERNGSSCHNKALGPGDSSKLFCSWKCVKQWNKKNTPLQLRYHTEVMIDFAAALATEGKPNLTR